MTDTRAVLFTNIGSPSAPTVGAVRRYLNSFLTDKRIIPLPSLLRHLLVRGIITPFRAPLSRRRYAQVWLPEGAPLDVYTSRLAAGVRHQTQHPTYVAMRYRPGDVEQQLLTMQSDGIEHATVVPLYPQYARSSFESTIDHILTIHERLTHDGRISMEIDTLPPYYHHAGYIEAYAQSIATYLRPGDHLLLSFHGIPLSQVRPYTSHQLQDYPRQCHETAHLLLKHPYLCDLSPHVTHEIVYQSRFDNRRWLTPSLAQRLRQLPSEGKASVVVACPSFVCDCLETLEEIGIMGHDDFIAAGGTQLTLVPAPNDSDTMVQAFARMLSPHSPDYLPPTPLHLWTSPR